ncbi:MAG: class I SAM-dependent methyltransferase [Casimicrobiaceae bacterium]
MQAFGPLSTLFRDADRPRGTDAEIAWYLQRVPPGGLCLELMCGYGRLLAPLAATGGKFHGVDQSPAMLARCEEKLAAQGATAPTFRQDIVQMNLPFRYGCAFVAGGSFQLISDAAEVAAALERIRAHLVDPGMLFIECRIPAEGVQRLGAPLVEVRTAKLDDGTQIALRSETTWNADARIMRAQNRYAHRRRAERLAEEHEKITMTWYPPDEIADIVRAAGFHEVASGPAAANDDEGEAFMLSARA